MTKDFRSIHAAAAEYLVLGDLLRNHNEAYLAHGATQPDWDIICLHDEKTLRIQVKGVDYPIRNAVNLRISAGFDFLVVVLLNRNISNAHYYIFRSEEVASLLSKVNINRKDKNKTLNFSRKNIIKFSTHLDRWWYKDSEEEAEI